MRSQKIPQIVNVIPEGIFSKIESLPNVTLPWTENNTLLDIDYIYRWSGYKSISPLVKHLLGTEGTMPAAGYTTLAGIIWAYYGEAWTRKYDALTAEYDPLKNYDMSETENEHIVDDATTGVTGTAANNSTTVNSSHNVYGYNSSTATPSESDSATTSQNTDMTTDYDNDRTISRGLKRSGNIGVTTSQQMLESELNLRAYRFFEEVYKDVDRIVSLPIYDGEITGAIYASGGGTGVGVTSVNNKTGDVTLYGTDINLTSIISQSVATAIENLNTEKRNKPVTLTATLTAGQTSVSVNNAAIGDNSIIDIYFNMPNVNMTNWAQVGTVFTMTFEALASDLVITMEVFN